MRFVVGGVVELRARFDRRRLEAPISLESSPPASLVMGLLVVGGVVEVRARVERRSVGASFSSGAPSPDVPLLDIVAVGEVLVRARFDCRSSGVSFSSEWSRRHFVLGTAAEDPLICCG